MWRGVIDGVGGALSKHAVLNLHACTKKGRKKPLEKSELQGSVFEKYVLLHMPEHTLKHAPGSKKTSGQSVMTVGGDAERGGGKKKGGHLLTTVSLPQSHTNTKAHTFSGSQRTFGASCRGLRVSCSRRGLQSLLRRQEILKTPDVSIRFDLKSGVKRVGWLFFIRYPAQNDNDGACLL